MINTCLQMDDVPEDPGLDESQDDHLSLDMGTTKELIRQMNDYMAYITQLPIEANDGDESMCQSSSDCHISVPRKTYSYRYSAKEDKGDGEEARREINKHAIVSSTGGHGGDDDTEQDIEYCINFEDDSVVVAKEYKSDGKEARRETNNRAIVLSIDENGRKNDTVQDIEYCNDFEDDSVVAMAKRMDDASILTLPTTPLPKKKSGNKLRRSKLAKSDGDGNRIEAISPAPQKNADADHAPPIQPPAKQITAHSPASAPTSGESKSISNPGRSIPSRKSSYSPATSKERVEKTDGYRRVSSDSANSRGHRVGGVDLERASGGRVVAIGSNVSAPRGRRPPKHAPISGRGDTMDRCGTGSKLDEPLQRDKIAAHKTQMSTSPRHVTRRHSNPKTIRMSPPRSQLTQVSQMPSEGFDGQKDARISDKVHTRFFSEKSQGAPRAKHSQNSSDSSECDEEDSDAQTQFFYESTDDEEELEGVGTSVADAVKNLNEGRAVAKVKNLLGFLF